MIVVTMITLIENTYLTADFINYRYLDNQKGNGKSGV